MNIGLAISPGESSPGLAVRDHALALHTDALVFDGQAIADVLQERCARACLEGGVNAAK
jgi:hypothetical protein